MVSYQALFSLSVNKNVVYLSGAKNMFLHDMRFLYLDLMSCFHAVYTTFLNKLLFKERICSPFVPFRVAPMRIEKNFKWHSIEKPLKYISLFKKPNFDAAKIKCLTV